MLSVVLPYDADWPEWFEAEAALLRQALRPWLVAIEHVGSTAIPGMPAKPVIDMIAGVGDLEEARAATTPLQALDYHYRPHRPEALCYHKPALEEWRRHTHHLHLTTVGSDLWVERLTFRDALRADRELARKYAAWKLGHAVLEDSEGGPYDASKWTFVAHVLASKNVPLKPDVERLE